KNLGAHMWPIQFILIGCCFPSLFRLGRSGSWQPLNRWTFLVSTCCAICIFLDIATNYLYSRSAEPNYALGLAANIAIARKNNLLVHQCLVLACVAACFGLAGFPIFPRKVRRPTVNYN